jgi:hypothetical protein
METTVTVNGATYTVTSQTNPTLYAELCRHHNMHTKHIIVCVITEDGRKTPMTIDPSKNLLPQLTMLTEQLYGFVFDGHFIGPKDTAISFGVNDMDMIDAIIRLR